MAAANSNTRLVATAAAALRPRRPRPPALQTRALTAHSTGRRRRAQAAARPSEGGDTEVAERRRRHNCDPAGAGRRTVRAAPEAPGTGPGPRGSPWRPPPRASGRLLPAGCDRRAPELRVAARVSRGPRTPRMASDVQACPAPGWGSGTASASLLASGKPRALAHRRSEVSGGEQDYREPRVGVHGKLPQLQHRNLGREESSRRRRSRREGGKAGVGGTLK